MPQALGREWCGQVGGASVQAYNLNIAGIMITNEARAVGFREFPELW
jgi:hypothetical protein